MSLFLTFRGAESPPLLISRFGAPEQALAELKARLNDDESKKLIRNELVRVLTGNSADSADLILDILRSLVDAEAELEEKR